ncbi:hypothetical protein ACLI4Q_05570 [Natrialbaceae archaeon A-CW1-1]
MSRETAITEEILYDTEKCHICEEEVAVDDVPSDVIESEGYAVLLGDGNLTHELEDAGNWDEEFHFELEKEDTQLPTVEGYIICEMCAKTVHQIPTDTKGYIGSIPSDLKPSSGFGTGKNKPFSEDSDSNIILYIAIGLLILTLIILLI